jgi:hypothetical protein
MQHGLAAAGTVVVMAVATAAVTLVAIVVSTAEAAVSVPVDTRQAHIRRILAPTSAPTVRAKTLYPCGKLVALTADDSGEWTPWRALR